MTITAKRSRMDSELAGDLIFLKDAYLANGERIRGSQQEKQGEH
jgi:hypothetical protein